MAVIKTVTFDAGGFTEFGSTVNVDGDLTVITAAALAGTRYGMACLVNDETGCYGSDTALAEASGIIMARFYIDPNTLTMGASNEVSLLLLRNDTPATIMNVILFYSGGYHLAASAYDDGGAAHSITAYDITDAVHYFEVKLVRETNDSSNDGSIEMWIDGVSRGSNTTVDNYARYNMLNGYRLGKCISIGGGTTITGTYYLDELVINNDGGLIGPRTSTTDLGAKAFGYQFPTMGETGISWTTFSDGAGGAITVSGDPDWGKGELNAGEEMRSAVYDLGDIGTRTITLTPNRYGTGSGTATLQYRTDTSSFTQDSNVIGWTTYTVPFAVSCRYIQIRETK